MTESPAAESLEPLQGTRSEYTASFVRVKKGWNSYLQIPEFRIVFDNVQGSGSELLRDRQSFFFGKRFRALGNLMEGDLVRFQARVVLSKGGSFKLSRPTQIERADDTIQTQLD